MRESMLFCDEWDSTLIPPRESDLYSVADIVNKALAALNAPIDSGDIIKNHAKATLGGKRKMLLSATVGSEYTAALASGKSDMEGIKQPVIQTH